MILNAKNVIKSRVKENFLKIEVLLVLKSAEQPRKRSYLIQSKHAVHVLISEYVMRALSIIIKILKIAETILCYH